MNMDKPDDESKAQISVTMGLDTTRFQEDLRKVSELMKKISAAIDETYPSEGTAPR
jgi:hypothetical protein